MSIWMNHDSYNFTFDELDAVDVKYKNERAVE